MPTYEYACRNCDHVFEVFQSMRDEPLKRCPQCKKPTLKRLLGAGAGLIFKGSGFYITDYKNKPAGGAESGRSEGAGKGDAGAKSESGASTKPTESKPAAPTPSAGSKSASDAKPGSSKRDSHGRSH